jgi:hypothetical protein
MFGALGVEIRAIMQANARDLRRSGSITLIQKRRYFMRNWKRKKRRHPRGDIYQVQPTYGRGTAPQLLIRSSVMTNRNYQVGPSQGTNFNNPVRFSNYGDRQLGCCFICGDPNHYANNCPHRGPGQGAPLKLPYRNCQEYGHQE